MRSCFPKRYKVLRVFALFGITRQWVDLFFVGCFSYFHYASIKFSVKWITRAGNPRLLLFDIFHSMTHIFRAMVIYTESYIYIHLSVYSSRLQLTNPLRSLRQASFFVPRIRIVDWRQNIATFYPRPFSAFRYMHRVLHTRSVASSLLHPSHCHFLFQHE